MGLACILDYQQSRLENHASRLPHEMQVATKYMIDMASEVPHTLEDLFYSAKGGIIIITGKMHIGDKTVAQLLFGKQVIEEDKKDSINESEPNIDDQILEKVEEIATKLKKQEEMHIYEANRKEMKEKTLKTLEADKKVAEASLLEEKEKLKEKLKKRIDKNEAMTNVLKTNSKDRQNDGDKIDSSFITSKNEEAQGLEDAENVGRGKRDFKKKYEEDEAF